MKSILVFLIALLTVCKVQAQGEPAFVTPIAAPTPNPVAIGGSATGLVTLRVFSTYEGSSSMAMSTGDPNYVISSASIISGPSISSFDAFDLSDPTTAIAYMNGALAPGDYVFSYTVKPSGTVPDPVGNLVAFQFGGAAAQTSSILVLPVKLISFTAKREEGLARLKWSTTEEVNSDYFEIQQSGNSKDWFSAGTLKSRNNGLQNNDYDYTVSQVRNGRNYFRLKMVDFDGSYAFSPIRSLSFESIKDDLLTFGPNPASDYLRIDMDKKVEINTIKIIDKAGRSVYSSGTSVERTINLNHLENGLYILQVISKNGAVTSKNLLVIR